nr:hypothetical protein CFP56_58802 [Quercus suber]
MLGLGLGVAFLLRYEYWSSSQSAMILALAPTRKFLDAGHQEKVGFYVCCVLASAVGYERLEETGILVCPDSSTDIYDDARQRGARDNAPAKFRLSHQPPPRLFHVALRSSSYDVQRSIISDLSLRHRTKVSTRTTFRT